jgi:hypothetical protein
MYEEKSYTRAMRIMHVVEDSPRYRSFEMTFF